MDGLGKPVLLIEGAPWSHVPSSAESAQLREADLVVWSGAELEPGLETALADRPASRSTLEVLAADEIKVLWSRADDSRRDPFWWLDSRNMLTLVDLLTRRLVAIDPENHTRYERNRDTHYRALVDLDRFMEFRYRDVSGKPVFLYHDNHQYFEQAYAMHTAATVAEPPADPTALDAGRLLTFRDTVLQAGADACVFTERGLDEPNLEFALLGTGVEPVELDSLGLGLEPGQAFYGELMRANFAAIADCVRAGRPEVAAGMPTHAEIPDVERFPTEVVPRYLMVDQYGRTVTNSDFPGQLQLIYFGYTQCPDVCPTSLVAMTEALKLVGDDAERVQPIFITVDPARDNPRLLGEYVNYFDKRILALSSGAETTRRIAELFKARYEILPPDGDDPNRYAVDHTASLYLLGKRGEFITKFAHGMPPGEIAERLVEYLN
jgi:protein SCO1/2